MSTKNDVEVHSKQYCKENKYLLDVGDREKPLENVSITCIQSQENDFSSTVLSDFLTRIDTNKHRYAYIFSPYIQPDNRIVRHKKLDGLINEILEFKPSFIPNQKVITVNEGIIFSSLIAMNENNTSVLLDLISRCKNGIIFSFNEDVENPSSIDSDLEKFIQFKPNPRATCTYNLDRALDYLLEIGSNIIIPEAWNETSDYSIEIISKIIK